MYEHREVSGNLQKPHNLEVFLLEPKRKLARD